MKNLIKKIRETSERVQEVSYEAYNGTVTPELIAQLKILNGLTQTLVNILGDPSKDEFMCERPDCPIYTKLKDFETLHYHIYHHMLFGPLSTILGLVNIIQLEVSGKRFGKLPELQNKLEKEVDRLKRQVTVILEAKNGNGDNTDST